MTQQELAKKLGITRSSVNAWELGISIPSTQYVIALAQLFQVSTDYLLGMDNSATMRISGLSEADVQLIIGIISRLKEKNQASDL